MKLNDVIRYLREPEKLNKFLESEKISGDTEELIIYMKNSLSIDSEIKFFGMEETGDLLNFGKDGIDYVQLFPISLATDALEFLNLTEEKYDDLAAAKRLLDYRINDA